jgi:hypothetical protein
MTRYYAIATAFVIGALVIGANGARRGPAIDVRSVQATGSPSPPRPQSPSTLAPAAVTGAAPWALSALPECFVQESRAHGPVRYVLAQLPMNATQLPGNVVSRVGDCTVRVFANSALVERGSERLSIPPSARFWVAGRRLAYVRTTGRNAELRVYHRVDNAVLIFVADDSQGQLHANCRTSKRKC